MSRNKTIEPDTAKTPVGNPYHEHLLKSVRAHPQRFFQKMGNGRGYDDFIYQMLQYLVDLSIDEFHFGHGNRVELIVDFDSGKMGIRDNGRGFPLSNLAHCFEFPQWGMRPSNDVSPQLACGLSNGVVNALSSHFRVRSVRDGEYGEVVFVCGKLVSSKKGTSGPDENNGTFVEWIPDATILPKYTVVEELVVRRIRDCATANPGLTFVLNGREMGRFFNWASLSARNWAELLVAQPQFADRCDKWGEMDGKCWAWLLRTQPQFAEKCDWAKLSREDWLFLLQKDLRFADKCDWSKLKGFDWCLLLADYPQLADRCDWRKTRRYGMGRLLEALLRKDGPSSRKRIECSSWDVAWVLSRLPQFANRFNCWDRFGCAEWAMLLARQPRFAKHCDQWERFDVDQWVNLLKAQPRFAARCDKWNELDGLRWVWLLSEQPQFARRCRKWGELDGELWARLLVKQPQLARKCDWKKLPQFSGK